MAYDLYFSSDDSALSLFLIKKIKTKSKKVPKRDGTTNYSSVYLKESTICPRVCRGYKKIQIKIKIINQLNLDERKCGRTKIKKKKKEKRPPSKSITKLIDLAARFKRALLALSRRCGLEGNRPGRPKIALTWLQRFDANFLVNELENPNSYFFSSRICVSLSSLYIHLDIYPIHWTIDKFACFNLLCFFFFFFNL